jgi:hypothetical protein
MEQERQYNGQKKKDKRTHIDLQNSFTCTGLKYSHNDLQNHLHEEIGKRTTTLVRI